MSIREQETDDCFAVIVSCQQLRSDRVRYGGSRKVKQCLSIGCFQLYALDLKGANLTIPLELELKWKGTEITYRGFRHQLHNVAITLIEAWRFSRFTNKQIVISIVNTLVSTTSTISCFNKGSDNLFHSLLFEYKDT